MCRATDKALSPKGRDKATQVGGKEAAIGKLGKGSKPDKKEALAIQNLLRNILSASGKREIETKKGADEKSAGPGHSWGMAQSKGCRGGKGKKDAGERKPDSH